MTSTCLMFPEASSLDDLISEPNVSACSKCQLEARLQSKERSACRLELFISLPVAGVCSAPSFVATRTNNKYGWFRGIHFWAALRSPAKGLTFSGSNGNYHETLPKKPRGWLRATKTIFSKEGHGSKKSTRNGTLWNQRQPAVCRCLNFEPRPNPNKGRKVPKWQWLKNRCPKWVLGTWARRPKPAVCPSS